MHKRIKELAIKAGGGPSKWYNDSDVLEYFAELIVRECMTINNQFVGHRIGEIDLDIVYKEHFGVEK